MMRLSWQHMQKSHSAILFARSNSVNCYSDVAVSAELDMSGLTFQPLLAGIIVSSIRGEGKRATPLTGIRSQISVKYRERGKAKRC